MSLTAWDVIGYDGPAHIRIAGGRTLYETAFFYDNGRTHNVRLARLDTKDGLRQVNRYVDPDTEVELVQPCDCMTEPDPYDDRFECVLTHSSSCPLHPEHES